MQISIPWKMCFPLIMKIGITGASGWIGSRLRLAAEAVGCQVTGFSRHGGTGEMRKFSLGEPIDCWGLDAIVHLAGEPILGLWTRAKRERIRESRVLGTRRVVEGLRAAATRPRVLVCASAVGYYGDTGEQECDECAPQGHGFLAEVSAAWEAEALRATDLGIRTVLLRIGFVIGRGGAMSLIRPLFLAGLGGRLGSGNQWMSGIHVEDVAGMALWACQNPEISGPLNAVMPQPFRNADFTKTLGRNLRRPTIFPVPSLLLKLALGDLSRVMLDHCRVRPAKACSAGYPYRHPSLESALKDLT